MSEYIAEQFTHNGYTVKIIQDHDAQAPNDDGDDNGLFLVTTKNRHFQVLQNGDDAQACYADKDLRRTHWVFPVYAYVHSGVALSLDREGQFADMWDSGHIGFVFAAKSEWRYQYRERKKCVSAFKAAGSLVEQWNQYLSGDVYGFEITTPDGRDVDSCWGHYGLDWAIQAAKDAVPVEPAPVGGDSEDDSFEEVLS